MNANHAWWSHYTNPSHLQSFQKTGFYSFSRHPYYWLTVVELIAFGVFFQSYLSLFITLFGFLPLAVIRVNEEERGLVSKFGDDYREYQKSVSVLFNYKKR